MRMYSRTCYACKQDFLRNSSDIASRKRHNCIIEFCSKKCYKEYLKNQKVEVNCKECDKGFFKKPNQILKTKNNFCSRSCAVTYNNKNKKFGTKRSKLEVFIEKHLLEDFPFINFLFNSKEVIKSELDIFIPQLRLAIELNGIFHYEPIYGENKLEKIKNNDVQKSIACFQNDIELCIIDTSACKDSYESKNKYYNIIKNLVVQNIGRAEKTNEQVS